MASTMRRPHAVVVPYPTSGHINPTLKLAELLHFKGFYITFVNTEDFHQRTLRSAGPEAPKDRDNLQFETIPDGLSPSERDGPDYLIRLHSAIRRSCAAPFRELLVKLQSSPDVPPVTCIIYNFLMSFTLDVAEEFGIPALDFWTTSACGFMGSLQLGELIKRGYTPLKDESCLTNGYLDTVIDWIPGVKDIRLRDISSFVRTLDPHDFFLDADQECANTTYRAWGVILNTFDDMEQEVLNALKTMFNRIYTVGPLHALLDHITGIQKNPMSLSLWEEDSSCIEWLNAQRASSVVYVSFGSLTLMNTKQLEEFAWGLADSNHPFLWVIRAGLVPGGLNALPEEFVMETKDRCFLAGWCRQEAVLSHPSIGGVLTHGGWNSTLESVRAGVPMICWPGFADQYTNCRYACKEWGIGMEIDEEVKREQVQDLIKQMMDGERGLEMHKNAMIWRRKAKRAATDGGSSCANLQRLAMDLDHKQIQP